MEHLLHLFVNRLLILASHERYCLLYSKRRRNICTHWPTIEILSQFPVMA